MSTSQQFLQEMYSHMGSAAEEQGKIKLMGHPQGAKGHLGMII